MGSNEDNRDSLIGYISQEEIRLAEIEATRSADFVDLARGRYVIGLLINK